MGAGASSDGGELEQLVACTYLLGQALASMSFPDMYRIQDFHAEDAPALRSARGLAADRENAAREAAQPFDYGSRFNVMVSGERIVLDDVARENPDGWTPLHACCHSHATTTAALAIVEELVRNRASLEARTRRGGPARAPKDLANGIGWTPLHEAAFYNHVDVVRSLLVYGADATLRDAQDALAYHVASLGSVRDVLEEMGGELCGNQIFNPTSMRRGRGRAARGPRPHRLRLRRRGGPGEPRRRRRRRAPARRGQGRRRPSGAAASAVEFQRRREAEDETDAAPAFLHRGESSASCPPCRRRSGRARRDARRLSEAASSADRRRLSPGAAPAPAPDASTPARGGLSAAPSDAPEEFLCAISRRVLKEPLASPYGHAFEAKVIRAWFAKNGSICPLTGQPLVESELKIHDALKTKITNWEVTRTLASVSAASPEPPAKETAHQHDDDLYDF
ncbi:hypothetical protein JL722_4535 [Aureococcus anophagefferens]|nr:hypothetical protein JL722_4535 [Aureococcus anophagefferens]